MQYHYHMVKKKYELKTNVDKYRFKVDELQISQNALNINIFYNINRILIIEQVKLTGYSLDAYLAIS